MQPRPRFGLPTSLSWAIDLATVAGIVHLFSRSAVFGASALVIFAVAPLLPIIGRRRALRSAVSGIPTPLLGEGRAFVRLEPPHRAWVVEPFYASMNVSLCVLAFLLPYGLICREQGTPELIVWLMSPLTSGSWSRRGLTPAHADAETVILGLGLLGPTFIGAVGLAGTRMRLMEAVRRTGAPSH